MRGSEFRLQAAQDRAKAGLQTAGIKNRGSPRAYVRLRDRQGTWKRLFPIGSNRFATRLNDKNQIAYTERAHSLWEDMRNWFFRPRLPRLETVSYLWDPVRGRIPLNRYVRGMMRFYVEDLNNRGCIVGTAEYEQGARRSVLLGPIAERWDK